MRIVLAAVLIVSCSNDPKAPSSRPSSGPVTYDAPIRARDAAVGRRADAGTNLGPVATSDAAPEPARDALVDLHTVDDSIELDIRYATTNNFTKTAVYPVARCRLRYAVATRLVAVHRALSDAGYALKIWDCYRPISVQQAFWKLVPDSRYVAEPVIENGKAVKGSKHNRGAAVDLTLVDAKGAPVEMPTDYDDFSEKAHRDADATDAAKRHRKILRDAMEAQGFSALPTEWWHFDGPDWRTYALSDEPL